MIQTRKIQIYINAEGEEKKRLYDMLYQWRYICFKLYNQGASHKFTLDNLKDYIYLSEGVKVKLADEKKEDDGILNCSYQNSVYKLYSKKYKGEMPAAIFSAVNTNLHKVYITERNEYFSGIRSLRSYRKTTPIPMPKTAFYNWHFIPEKSNYSFTLFNSEKYMIPFMTRLGRDRSGNGIILNRVLDGDYPLSDSAIYIDDSSKKIFLLLCVDIPKTELKKQPGKYVFANLDLEIPIKYLIENKNFEIGNKEEFLYNRLRIQDKLRRLQISLRYAKNGKGRKSKLQAIDRFHRKEKNYIQTKLHTYASMLVQAAVKAKAEKIILVDQKEKETDAKREENKFLLRNWSYYGLIEKITYKAAKTGIVVEKSSLN